MKRAIVVGLLLAGGASGEEKAKLQAEKKAVDEKLAALKEKGRK